MSDTTTAKQKPESGHRKATHRWQLDLTDTTTNVLPPPQPQRPPIVRTAIEEYLHPPGYPTTQSPRDANAFENDPNLSAAAPSSADIDAKTSAKTTADMHQAYRKSWTVAFSPLRSVCTSALALYLSGSRIQVFTIATTVGVLFMHLRTLLSVHDAFKPVLGIYRLPLSTIFPQLIVHAFLCLIGVLQGLYKANVLGFLPTTESDWIALIPVHTVMPIPFRNAPAL